MTLSSASINTKWSPVIDPLETGRVEKGEISNQTLKTINANFASTSFHTVTYKLLPSSTMNRTIGEVRQYCTDCGYRLRKENWTYCPKCGNKLN
jgi:Zn finger protein HypA/HybF involved in hydrogenase expression